MPYNGSGQYQAPANSWNPAVGGSTIDSADWNSTQSDYETALSSVICKDGQTTPTANLPMGGFKHAGVNTNSGSTSRSEYASGATLQDGAVIDAGTTGGTDTAYTATLTPAIAAYADKQCFRVQFNATCGSTPTLNLNSVGDKKLYKNVSGTPATLSASDILANQVWQVRYDSTLDSSAGGWMVLGFSAPFSGGTITSTLTMSGAAINEAKGSDIASATTTDIGAATGNFVDVTGTTTITGLGTVQAGTRRIVRFTGALTLTYNATSLILPGAANITTAAGDIATFESLGSGNWVCCTYQRAAGLPVFTRSFTSSDITISNAGSASVAHGLGVAPQLVQVVLRCTTAEFNYSIGDIVPIETFQSSDAANGCGVSLTLNSTTAITYRFTNKTTPFQYFNATTGANVALTNASWVMIIRAFA